LRVLEERHTRSETQLVRSFVDWVRANLT